MIIVLLGPQGSGKGTQAEMLSKKLDLFHAEGGAILRKKAEKDERIKRMINKGTLVPDQEMLGYYEEYINKNNKGRFDNLIFDGFPRNIEQHIALEKWLSKKGRKVDYVIYINISDGESVRRLSSRRTCSKCGEVYNLITNPPPGGKCECGGELVQREDDKPEIITKRLGIYHSETEPIIDIAKKKGILIPINGEQKIDKVFLDTLDSLNG